MCVSKKSLASTWFSIIAFGCATFTNGRRSCSCICWYISKSIIPVKYNNQFYACKKYPPICESEIITETLKKKKASNMKVLQTVLFTRNTFCVHTCRKSSQPALQLLGGWLMKELKDSERTWQSLSDVLVTFTLDPNQDEWCCPCN